VLRHLPERHLAHLAVRPNPRAKVIEAAIKRHISRLNPCFIMIFTLL
jgi:hypothetical protein